jgi:hypothetical protein
MNESNSTRIVIEISHVVSLQWRARSGKLCKCMAQDLIGFAITITTVE